jgi:two-component system CheB/CheR fusion protein
MSTTDEFVIAALGASAGGLQALEKFFEHMPADAGISFIVVQHLAPDHATALPELLARCTAMPVEQARDHTPVVPNRVYVIPPNATLTISHSVLQVAPPVESRGHRTPIDSLFRSLAEDRGEHAVCIILSGTGTDGTLGIKAIKEYGGMAMAQTLESATYDSILRSAISTGLVDYVLPVDQMPPKLLEYAAYLGSTNGNATEIGNQIVAHIGKIHALLRRRVGHDFSQYKVNTITRRLARRMKALQIETVEGYIHVLEEQPEEADRLFKDLLIGVTGFFRDPEAFETLAREVIPKLFAGKTTGDQVRACVVGCATGEEAYSIAILLAEQAATLASPPAIKVFATDIDERSLEMARKGRYPDSIAEHVSPQRLQSFFTAQENAYLVKRELRELCIFTNHSFIKDPPFARQDLISCRNVMIYLSADLQQKIIPLFHYALRPGGYLFLGPSESALSHRDLFRTVDKHHRIFQKTETVPRPSVKFPLAEISRPKQSGTGQPETEEQNLSRQLEHIIVQRYRPACVAVRENGDAVYFSGGVSRYLRQPAGSPSTNAIAMAQEGLRILLRTALHKSMTTHERVVQKQISVQTEAGAPIQVDLTVEPIAEFQAANLYMIIFEEVLAAKESLHPAAQSFDPKAEETIRQLEDQLRTAQEHSQAAFEELESSNEELKSANEEYQSTNEELETSKEEVQSFNEELETVNAELNRRVAELDAANSDLLNLNASTRIATIFLDAQLHIRSFTPAAADVFHLIAGDVGRPITDLAPQFADEGFVDHIGEVLRTLAACERDIAGVRGKHYLMRVLPYRTVHNVIDGVVVTFTDVTSLKQAQQHAEEARRIAEQAKLSAEDAQVFAENIVDTVREPLLVLDADLRVKSANRAFHERFQLNANETAGHSLYELGDRRFDIPDLRRLLHEILIEKKQLEDFRVEWETPRNGPETVLLLNARQLIKRNGEEPLILLAIEDITARTRAMKPLQDANRDLKHFAYAASHDLQEPLRMVTSYTQLLARHYAGKTDPLAEQFIAYAVGGAQRMEMLLNGLREYWSINEEQTVNDEVADCNRIVEMALANLANRIEQSGAVVTHDSLPSVRAEIVPLELLFQNLIGNGLKYVRKGEAPRVHIAAQHNGSEWEFLVRDNGIGVEAKYLSMIFTPFKRLHGAAEYPGSGLGLAICKRIVERYKGRIWAESTYGHGSTFHFTLPGQPGEQAK